MATLKNRSHARVDRHSTCIMTTGDQIECDLEKLLWFSNFPWEDAEDFYNIKRSGKSLERVLGNT